MDKVATNIQSNGSIWDCVSSRSKKAYELIFIGSCLTHDFSILLKSFSASPSFQVPRVHQQLLIHENDIP
ncbi:MAG: hypothetical protein AAF632_17705 [Bacteroidota bacterium]